MTKQNIGRLAMRHEGTLWNAYYAEPGTMENALYLGGVQMRFVETEDRRKAFMLFMKEAVGDLIEEQTGQRPEWREETPAPEHERTRE